MKGILFSKELLPKVHDGSKTVTRRCEKSLEEINKESDKWVVNINRPFGYQTFTFWKESEGKHIDLKPRYHEGETVYVKEAWLPQESDSLAGGTEAIIVYKDDEAKSVEYTLDADWWESHKLGVWKSPLFMPEWASRTKLLITKVSVERLQEITEEDCLKEGITEKSYIDINGTCRSYQSGFYVCTFQNLWNSLNKERGFSWESNPWVFRYQFERVSTPDKREG